jgi:hypothetical protein
MQVEVRSVGFGVRPVGISTPMGVLSSVLSPSDVLALTTDAVYSIQVLLEPREVHTSAWRRMGDWGRDMLF